MLVPVASSIYCFIETTGQSTNFLKLEKYSANKKRGVASG